MKKITNDCCDCATPAYPCRGNACPLRNVEHYVCDECGEETTLYEYDGKQLCEYCLLEAVPVVKESR